MDSVELPFPLGGTWLVGEFGEQPALTTVSGVNVRAQDPFEQRLRGGSRRGTSKLMPVRVNGIHPVQCLDFVVTADPAASLFAFDQSDGGPGTRIADPSTSNFPNGPGPTGPGGNAQGGPFGPPDFNRRQPAVPHTVRQGGNGVMRQRTTSPLVPPVVPPVPPVPPPPPPPGFLTRTYVPYAAIAGAELFGTLVLGPWAVPLTPPTNLLADGQYSLNDGALGLFAAMSVWAGTTLPTKAELNAIAAADPSYAPFLGGHPGGPWETSSDT